MTENARLAGARVLLGREFLDGRVEGPDVHLPHIGTARYLVGADGPGSRVAREFSLGQNREALSGIEYEYEPVELEQPDYLHCFIDRQLAPGYICWVVNGVNVVQVGLALRYRADATLAPKEALERFLVRIRRIVDLRDRQPVSVRAGRIPCGGLVNPLAAPRVLLVGDAAGMVSPVTAGGIHTALKHGWAAGEAIARFLNGQAADPAGWFVKSYPRFLSKRALRFLYDHFQSDFAFNLLLGSPLMRAAAELIYFHHQGVFGKHSQRSRR
jgi:flavin-dependent dehydrogenase